VRIVLVFDSSVDLINIIEVYIGTPGMRELNDGSHVWDSEELHRTIACTTVTDIGGKDGNFQI
jgi:hypothetical protein